MTEKVELLAPAGDLTKLKTAIDFGADAVYLGGQAFGLRAGAKNFGLKDLEEGLAYAHARGKQVHVTMNIIPHDRHMEGLDTYVKTLHELGVDALIVADPGMFSMIKEAVPDFEIHMSTQGSLTNLATVKFWRDQGASRVVLARELSLEEIREIVQGVEGTIEIETFLHGAMCMSYSGRCLLSNYMTNRDANLGDCSQPCRYSYRLVEETRPGVYFPIVEEDEGSFILNSKDLCMIGHVDELIEAGIRSLKIEGRIKSEYYLATVIRSYRRAIDRYYEDPSSYQYDPEDLAEIKKVSHRDFTTGFYFGEAKYDGTMDEDKSYIRTYDFAGRVLDYDKKTGRVKIEQRNRVFSGDEVEVFGPGRDHLTLTLEDMRNEEGQAIESANHPKMVYTAKIDREVRPGDFIRIRREED